MLRLLLKRFPPFLQAYFALTAVIHVPFALIIKEAAVHLGSSSPWQWGLGAGLAGTALFLFASRTWQSDYATHRAAGLLVDLPYWIHWCACLLASLPDAIITAVAAGVSVAREAPVELPIAAFAAVYAVTLGVALYGTLLRRRRFVVREISLPIKGLPAAFDGYRIAHLSDLHIGSTTPGHWARQWMDATNRLVPDLTVVTGDLISSGNAFHEEIAEVLAALSAADGVYISLGNHDYFGDGERLVERLRARGGCVLRNEGVPISRQGAWLYLAAVDDTWTRRADLPRALASRPGQAPTVLLAHDPACFPLAAQHGVSLTLSGHTHGGQIRVPWLPPPSRRLHLGLYRRGDSTLFVHPGLGTTGPPMRLGVPPTIVLYQLRSAP